MLYNYGVFLNCFLIVVLFSCSSVRRLIRKYAARSDAFDEPLCMSSLMQLQKMVVKVSNSLEEKIPNGLALRPSRISPGSGTTSMPRWSLPSTSQLQIPGLVPEPAQMTSQGPAGNGSLGEIHLEFLLVCAVFVTIWIAIATLVLLWIRFSDLGYRTSTVSWS